MKDYSAMSDFDINKAVAFKLGLDWSGVTEENRFFYQTADYCNNPADAWPIIVENRISLIPEPYSGWVAISELSIYPTSSYIDDRLCDKVTSGDQNPLRAAMIVYLQMMEGK